MKRRHLINNYSFLRNMSGTCDYRVGRLMSGLGRVLGSGNTSVGRAGTGLLHVGLGFVGLGRAGF